MKEDPRLSGDGLNAARAILDDVRRQLDDATQGDTKLLFKLRRYVYLRLTFDERGSPTHRKALKAKKREEQRNLCPLCKETLPVRGAVLDRLLAVDGYSPENTRLLCHQCDRTVQAERRFA